MFENIKIENENIKIQTVNKSVMGDLTISLISPILLFYLGFCPTPVGLDGRGLR